MRSVLPLLSFVVAGVALGCSSTESVTAEEDVSAGEQAFTRARKTAEVKALDALVTSINGYASPDAYLVEHPRDYVDGLDSSRLQDGSPRCEGRVVNEAAVRAWTRERSTGHVRKVGVTWSGERGDVSITSHETGHYDAEGQLRVVVVDRESDHVLDDAFMADVMRHNERINQELRTMPSGSEAEKVALAQKGRELRDSTTVVQYRIYYRADGTKLYETVRKGLERARAIDFPDIPSAPPVLFGVAFPANVTAEPVLEGLFPHPRHGFRELPELEVPPEESIEGELLVKSGIDAEAALAAPLTCL